MADDFSEEPEEGGGGAPEWMVTFSDMVTLLLTFFILLLSFANTDAEKFRDMLGSVKDAFGVQTKEPGQFEQKDRMVEEGTPNIIELRQNEKLLFFQEIKKLINEKKLGGQTELEMDKDGFRLRIEGQALFSSGSAELSSDIYSMLDEIKGLIQKYDYTLIVEGHTDNVPIKSNIYPSNWELSSARAISVIRYFMEKLDLPPKKLQAVGYSDTRPLVANDTPENRSKNRRVEFKFEQPLLKNYHQRVAVQPTMIQPDIFLRDELRKETLKDFQRGMLDKSKDVR